jgi:hypothetical protein
MGQATPFALRKEIIDLRLSGMKHSLISEALRVPYSTVKLIWYRYQQRGEAGLGTDYAHSGVKHKRSAPPAVPGRDVVEALAPRLGCGPNPGGPSESVPARDRPLGTNHAAVVQGKKT